MTAGRPWYCPLSAPLCKGDYCEEFAAFSVRAVHLPAGCKRAREGHCERGRCTHGLREYPTAASGRKAMETEDRDRKTILVARHSSTTRGPLSMHRGNSGLGRDDRAPIEQQTEQCSRLQPGDALLKNLNTVTFQVYKCLPALLGKTRR